MRILFSSRPAFGHVYPLMPLALAARDAGHNVTFATTGVFPNRLRAGFTTHDVGLTIEQARDLVLADLPVNTMPKGDDGRPELEFGSRTVPRCPCSQHGAGPGAAARPPQA